MMRRGWVAVHAQRSIIGPKGPSGGLVDADAERGRGRPRGKDDGDDEEGGQHEKLAGGRKAGGSRVDRASTEDQHWHVERQDKKREQHAAAAQSQRERRTDGAD